MNNNDRMKNFDDVEIRRSKLAASYLQSLLAQPGRPIALFAPRRVGKTFFLEKDMTPAAQAAGFTTVYADVWLHRTSPLEAITHALEEALDDATVPTTTAGRTAKTPIKKLGALGTSVEWGDSPKRRPLPNQPELRFDTLIARLSKALNQPILLMLDEIQVLARLANGESIVATLRAVLQKRKDEVSAIFTGSSQDELSTVFSAAGGPMYQFAQLQVFPVLGEDYLQLLAAHFARVHQGKLLDLPGLHAAFERLGFKPALMKDLVKLMSAEGITDIQTGLKLFARDERQVAGWRGLLSGMTGLEMALVKVVAQGGQPLSRETLKRLGKVGGISPTIPKVRVALDHLKRSGILSKYSGSYRLEDQLFADYLLGQS
jgi:hypothetical protein